MNSIHLNRTECLIIDIIYVGQYMKSFINNHQFNSEVNPWTNETNTRTDAQELDHSETFS